MTPHRLSAYSLVEIILVTTFLIIFIVVMNPATYIERFSKMLLKMMVLDDVTVMNQKLNLMGFDSCDPILASPTQFKLNTKNEVVRYEFSSQSFGVTNPDTGLQGVLYQHIDTTVPPTITYYDAGLIPVTALDQIHFFRVQFDSSLLNYSVDAWGICRRNYQRLGEF
ncbi:MAG: hypothetical protein ACO3K7_06570 [Candidatus Marinamargulisbacteria bacterium]